jgi:RNA polymerase sigma factor (sigma-70 family)
LDAHDVRLLELLQERGPALHALLTRLTLREDVAEDLLQELFLRLRHSAAFRLAIDPGGYATRAAVHLAFDWRRSARKSGHTDSQAEAIAGNPTPLEVLIRREDVARVLDALGSLPEAPRALIVMRYLQEDSFEAIGRTLGKTPHQARALCHKALRRLRGAFRTLDQDESEGADATFPPR